ncbi:MAG TPA: sulfurtransferase TusA family protein [Pseudomonadales bacterium]|jgi:tRNA 2-thiouridine synthesizing protein A
MSELETLDARGLLCPLPVIRTQEKVKGLPPGTVVEIVATDPGVMQDIPAWCRVHGHELISMTEGEEEAAAEGKADADRLIRGGREIRVRIKVRQ